MTDAIEDRVEKLTSEGLLSMRDAAAVYGRGVHKATVTRHAKKGVRVNGQLVVLEAIQVGGRLCTSRPAILRFFEKQNGAVPAAPTGNTPAQLNRRAAKASAELSALLGAA